MVPESDDHPQHVHHTQETGQENQTEARPEFVVVVVSSRTLYYDDG